MKRAIILEFDTWDDLAQQVAAISRGLRNPLSSQYEPVLSNHKGEVKGLVFERLMAEKGYRVLSIHTKKLKCKMFNIRMTKRGKEWYYSLSDIEGVPKRHTAKN